MTFGSDREGREGMFCVESYMQDVIGLLKEKFGNRLCYVGLQGSYLRGEATEGSDLDVVVVIDGVLPQDLLIYRQIISGLESYEKSCGFLCGREELKNWNPLEICNFLHGTRDYYGMITDFLPEFTREDVVNFIKVSVGNLYHEITHRYVHANWEKNKCKLPGSYKSVFFILQSVYYLQSGVFYQTTAELMQCLSQRDRMVMEKGADLANRADYDFEEAFSLLFTWCREILYRKEYENVHL